MNNFRHPTIWSIWPLLPILPKVFSLVLFLVSTYTFFSAAVIIVRLRSLLEKQ